MLNSVLSLVSDPVTVAVMLGGLTIGIVMGALPGLSGPMAMALLVGLTFDMAPEHAITGLAMIYLGGVYGGSQSAILLNIPGAAASAATALDGYPMAQQGRTGEALAASAAASMVGGVTGALMLIFLTPPLIEVSLKFGTWEFALLAVLGVVVAGSLSSTSVPVRGWVSGFLGLMIAMVGQDELFAYPRFAYGNVDLAGGLGLIPALVGLFGASEIIRNMGPKEQKYSMMTASTAGMWRSLRTFPRNLILTTRSGVIGTAMGIIPGAGADMGAWLSYDVARRTHKRRADFGRGAPEGVMAAEAGNSGVPAGSVIPLIALGLPGSAAAAVIMAGLFIHGLRPGPLFIIENRGMFETLSASLLVGSVALLVLGLLVSSLMSQALRIPRAVLMPVVLAFGVIGAYGSNLRMFSVWVMVIFGIVGLAMKAVDYPLAPMILGIVLGPILDVNFRRALTLSGGSLMPLVTRPITLVLTVIVATMVLWPVLTGLRARLSTRDRSGRR